MQKTTGDKKMEVWVKNMLKRQKALKTTEG